MDTDIYIVASPLVWRVVKDWLHLETTQEHLRRKRCNNGRRDTTEEERHNGGRECEDWSHIFLRCVKDWLHLFLRCGARMKASYHTSQRTTSCHTYQYMTDSHA